LTPLSVQSLLVTPLATTARPLFPYTTLFRSRAMEKDSGLTIESLRADGGLTSCRSLMQMQADLLGVPLEVAADAEATLRGVGFRSEEHTSELQSRFDLVCRLLLEKKKTQIMPLARSLRTPFSTTSHLSCPLIIRLFVAFIPYSNLHCSCFLLPSVSRRPVSHYTAS